MIRYTLGSRDMNEIRRRVARSFLPVLPDVAPSSLPLQSRQARTRFVFFPSYGSAKERETDNTKARDLSRSARRRADHGKGPSRIAAQVCAGMRVPVKPYKAAVREDGLR